MAIAIPQELLDMGYTQAQFDAMQNPQPIDTSGNMFGAPSLNQQAPEGWTQEAWNNKLLADWNKTNPLKERTFDIGAMGGTGGGLATLSGRSSADYAQQLFSKYGINAGTLPTNSGSENPSPFNDQVTWGRQNEPLMYADGNAQVEYSKPQSEWFDSIIPMLIAGGFGASLFGLGGGANLFGNMFGGGSAAATGAMDAGAGFGASGAGDAAGMLGNGLYGDGITSSIAYGANPTAVSSSGGNGMFDLNSFMDSFSPGSFTPEGYAPSAGSVGGAAVDTGLTGSELWSGLGSAPVGSGGFSLTDLLGNNGSSILKSLTGNGASLSSLLGKLGAAGLGAYASNQQSNALNDLAGRYEGYGAPYRARLSSLMANPDSFINSNEVQVPVQQGTNALMRSLSTSGNPFGSGNALQQGQNYASNSFYDKLQGKENQLAAFGGLANFNSAAPGASTAAIGAQGNAANAIGAGLNDIFNPPKTLAENLAAYKSLIG